MAYLWWGRANKGKTDLEIAINERSVKAKVAIAALRRALGK